MASEDPILQKGSAPVRRCSAWPFWSKAISFKKSIIWFQLEFTWCTHSITHAKIEPSACAPATLANSKTITVVATNQNLFVMARTYSLNCALMLPQVEGCVACASAFRPRMW